MTHGDDQDETEQGDDHNRKLGTSTGRQWRFEAFQWGEKRTQTCMENPLCEVSSGLGMPGPVVLPCLGCNDGPSPCGKASAFPIQKPKPTIARTGKGSLIVDEKGVPDRKSSSPKRNLHRESRVCTAPLTRGTTTQYLISSVANWDPGTETRPGNRKSVVICNGAWYRTAQPSPTLSSDHLQSRTL